MKQLSILIFLTWVALSANANMIAGKEMPGTNPGNTAVFYKTVAQMQALASSNSLVFPAFYFITDAADSGALFQSISTKALSSTGVAYFYSPDYSVHGIYRGQFLPMDVHTPIAIHHRKIWGNYQWDNIQGHEDNAPADNFNLDANEWRKIKKSSDSGYILQPFIVDYTLAYNLFTRIRQGDYQNENSLGLPLAIKGAGHGFFTDQNQWANPSINIYSNTVRTWNNRLTENASINQNSFLTNSYISGEFIITNNYLGDAAIMDNTFQGSRNNCGISNCNITIPHYSIQGCTFVNSSIDGLIITDSTKKGFGNDYFSTANITGVKNFDIFNSYFYDNTYDFTGWHRDIEGENLFGGAGGAQGNSGDNQGSGDFTVEFNFSTNPARKDSSIFSDFIPVHGIVDKMIIKPTSDPLRGGAGATLRVGIEGDDVSYGLPPTPLAALTNTQVSTLSHLTADNRSLQLTAGTADITSGRIIVYVHFVYNK